MGSEAFTWGDLYDFVTNMSLDSALARELNGGSVVWTLTDHLLATIADALHGANWQRGGGKGIRPKPIERPGEKSGTSLGSAPIPISEFDNWWNGE